MPDKLDMQILRMLQDNSKITIKTISDSIHLSATPVFERIRKLESDGFIKSYTIIPDRKKLGLDLMVYCNISLITHQKEFIEKFESDIQQIPEVVECAHIAGMYDYLLKVIVRDIEAYQYFLTNKLATLDNIGKVQSSFVLKEVAEYRGLPI
ncbi:MAG: Lrp/AsnC family transcriptional regulator [Saprospiraceae bacterium]|nr:Lrp/AsnC family transcriptional regulator [Saprospiraceae bacterium]